MSKLINYKKSFKAYDLRGKVPEELNEELAYRIGYAFAKMLTAQKVVVGRDIRLSGEMLATALLKGLTDAGCDVIDIGLCGTEMVYFSTTFLQADGGIMITASHNPKEYNGMKFVGKGSRPISSDTGLLELADMVLVKDFTISGEVAKGQIIYQDMLDDYVEHILGYIDKDKLKEFTIVVNAGNGCAGRVIDALEKHLPFTFVKIHHQADGSFPNGVPNPLLPEKRSDTAQKVVESNAILGIAWDGDFDRCFLFDEQGGFIEGYYIVGLLAEIFLRKYPGEKIIHDPRLVWNTEEIVQSLQGQTIECKSGHAFIKEKMRETNAIYGGEMSAHHYFREFTYCDSGMLPWLLIVELMSVCDRKLSDLVGERMAKFPCSGEINLQVDADKDVLAVLQAKYASQGKADYIDGLSVDLGDWRFNVRLSNTEPVVRVNVETRGDKKLLAAKTQEILTVIGGKLV